MPDTSQPEQFFRPIGDAVEDQDQALNGMQEVESYCVECGENVRLVYGGDESLLIL